MPRLVPGLALLALVASSCHVKLSPSNDENLPVAPAGTRERSRWSLPPIGIGCARMSVCGGTMSPSGTKIRGPARSGKLRSRTTRGSGQSSRFLTGHRSRPADSSAAASVWRHPALRQSLVEGYPYFLMAALSC